MSSHPHGGRRAGGKKLKNLCKHKMLNLREKSERCYISEKSFQGRGVNQVKVKLASLTEICQVNGKKIELTKIQRLKAFRYHMDIPLKCKSLPCFPKALSAGPSKTVILWTRCKPLTLCSGGQQYI